MDLQAVEAAAGAGLLFAGLSAAGLPVAAELSPEAEEAAEEAELLPDEPDADGLFVESRLSVR